MVYRNKQNEYSEGVIKDTLRVSFYITCTLIT